MTSKRLAPPFGQRLDRARSLSFEFNGRRLSGHPGDTLASALLANGCGWWVAASNAPAARVFLRRRGNGLVDLGRRHPHAQHAPPGEVV